MTVRVDPFAQFKAYGRDKFDGYHFDCMRRNGWRVSRRDELIECRTLEWMIACRYNDIAILPSVNVEEHIPCHKGAYMGKNGITRDRTGKLWYYRNSKR